MPTCAITNTRRAHHRRDAAVRRRSERQHDDVRADAREHASMMRSIVPVSARDAEEVRDAARITIVPKGKPSSTASSVMTASRAPTPTPRRACDPHRTLRTAATRRSRANTTSAVIAPTFYPPQRSAIRVAVIAVTRGCYRARTCRFARARIVSFELRPGDHSAPQFARVSRARMS